MKFKKFVKSLGYEGVIFERDNGDRWLSSKTAMMKIPDTAKGVLAVDIRPMPTELENLLDEAGYYEEAFLSEAVIPIADGGIKDCIRIYKTFKSADRLGITNENWGLLEKHDYIEFLSVPRTDGTAVNCLIIKTEQVHAIKGQDILGLILGINSIIKGA